LSGRVFWLYSGAGCATVARQKRFDHWYRHVAPAIA
jgi:hypothetical protein